MLIHTMVHWSYFAPTTEFEILVGEGFYVLMALVEMKITLLRRTPLCDGCVFLIFLVAGHIFMDSIDWQGSAWRACKTGA